MVLVQNTFADMGENANSVEQEINENLIGKDKEFSEFCRVVKSIGKPNYHPQYMISHGMGHLLTAKVMGWMKILMKIKLGSKHCPIAGKPLCNWQLPCMAGVRRI